MISFEKDGIEYRFFDHLYAVSKCGKVLRKLIPYEPSIRGDGYLGIGRQRLMHRVVAVCWIDNPSNAKHVHHKNGIKNDNRADNLEWLTPKQHFSGRHHETIGKHTKSDSAKQKCRDYRTGKKDSKETCEKKRKILDIVSPRTPCRYNGVIYRSVAEGARAAGILPTTFRGRCLSKNFSEYELLPTTAPHGVWIRVASVSRR